MIIIAYIIFSMYMLITTIYGAIEAGENIFLASYGMGSILGLGGLLMYSDFIDSKNDEL